jgi:diguanylate cyclase (GGDEF)-like protein/PAS domain S-box-containing protein
MSATEQRILLIARQSAETEVVRAACGETHDPGFAVECVEQLAAGLERLQRGQIDGVVLALFLPDSQGLATFERVSEAAPRVPVLIVCDAGDEPLARAAMERGAHDYLLTTLLDAASVRHALGSMIRRSAAMDALVIAQEHADITLDSIGEGVLSIDTALHVTYLNVAAERMTGLTREIAAGRPFAEVFQLVDGTTRAKLPNPLEVAVERGGEVPFTLRGVLIRRDGHEIAIDASAAPIRDRQGRLTGAVVVFRDASAAHALSLKLSHSAHHDALTGLPNRILLNDRLDRALASAHRHRRYRRSLAVMFVDVDHFKHINDSLGHQIGDQLLRSVSQRLITSVRSSDTVSRLGGDEFVVLLTEMKHADNIGGIATKILAILAEPHHASGHELHVTASIGVSVYPDDGADAETLLRHADLAMYQAKENGRSSFQFFRRDMSARAIERQAIEGELHGALDREEFVLHYQPEIDLESGSTIGAEALIRWQHPTRGLLPPAQFVPIAEDSGFIVPISQWTLHEACRQARAWQKAGLPPVPVAVNVSPVWFRSPGFLESVRGTLDLSGLESRYLELEFTEGVLMASGVSALSSLRGLKTMGVQLTLDDFGTGYSSLSHLNEFPLDVLKVDRSLVRGITEAPRGAPIVLAAIRMANSMSMRVIAEGIENAEQLALLRDQRCGEGQGFYFSLPLAAEQFATRLHRQG